MTNIVSYLWTENKGEYVEWGQNSTENFAQVTVHEIYKFLRPGNFRKQNLACWKEKDSIMFYDENCLFGKLKMTAQEKLKCTECNIFTQAEPEVKFVLKVHFSHPMAKYIVENLISRQIGSYYTKGKTSSWEKSKRVFLSRLL